MTSNHTLGHLARRNGILCSHKSLYTNVRGRFIHNSGLETTQMTLSGEIVEQALVQ